MATVVRRAQAGLEKKNDVLVTIEPADAGGIIIELTSPVRKEFGAQIEATVRAVLAENNVADCRVVLADKGALDFALRARLETAVRRATSEVEK